MATKYWKGNAPAVAQVSTGSIDSVDGTPANDTFTVTIGDQTVSVAGDTDVNTTATNLRAALNASTHPYFAAITWSGSGGNITGTADTAGVPFVVALTQSGGTGTVTDFSDTTANAGPNDWSTADNWSTGTVPVNSDDVIIENSSVNIAYGLDQNAVSLTSLTIKKTYTGKIGLDAAVFAQSADGETTTDSNEDEYRETYLKIGSTRIDLGEHFGPGSPSGSGRIKINQQISGTSDLIVHDTATTSAETGLPAVRYLASHASADVWIRSAPGGVGIAVDVPGETATVGTVSISDTSTTSKVQVGSGVTLTTFEQLGGQNYLDLGAATVTTVNVDGGTLTTEGDATITTLNVNAGTCNANHIKSGGNAITTANVDGGTLDGQASTEARTWATVNFDSGTIKGNDSITVTTFNESTNGLYSMTAS